MLYQLILFLTQVAPTAIEVEKTIEQKKGLVELILHADIIIQGTLIVLVTFSVVSWAIIFYKWSQMKNALSQSRNFWNGFARAKSLDEVSEHTSSASGPLYRIFQIGRDSLARLKNSGKSYNAGRGWVEHKISQAQEEEIYKLEQHTSFLATTASTTPFIGLFGTVCGILMAFWSIGKSGGQPTLVTVGPAISEALIATATGLAAAIPAYVAYNYFVRQIKVLIKMMDLFSSELSLKMEDS